MDEITRLRNLPNRRGAHICEFYLHNEFPKKKIVYATMIPVSEKEMHELFPCHRISEEAFIGLLETNEKGFTKDKILVVEIDEKFENPFQSETGFRRDEDEGIGSRRPNLPN
jgi:hypothetical protein